MFAGHQRGREPNQAASPLAPGAAPGVFMLIVRAMCNLPPVGDTVTPLLEQLFAQVGMPYKSITASTTAELAYEFSKLPDEICAWAVVIGHGNQEGLGFKDKLLKWNEVTRLLQRFRTRSLSLASCRAGQYPLKRIFLLLPELQVISASPTKMSPDSEAALGVEISLIVRREDALQNDFQDVGWDDVDAERTQRLKLLKDPLYLSAAQEAVRRWCSFPIDPAHGVTALSERLRIEEPLFERLLPDKPALGREMLVTVPFAVLLNPGFLYNRSIDLVNESIKLKLHVQKAFAVSGCSAEVKRLAAEVSRAFLPPNRH